MKLSFAIAAALALATTGALADEKWTTSTGEIVYEDEVGDVAIFSYPLEDGQRGHLYFPGLAGNYDNRGTHAGYWISPIGETCTAELTGADGLKSKDWGQLLLVFHSPAYPSAWTLISGTCFGPLDAGIVGTPKSEDEAAEEPPPPPPPAN